MDVVVMGRVGADFYANEINVPLKDVKTFSKYLGGCPGNISVGLARLGLKVGFISKVGNDPLGEFLLGFLSKEKVDTRCVTRTDNHRTSLAVVEVSPPDRFPVLFYRENCADTQIDLHEVKVDYIAQASFFLTSGSSLSYSPAREAVLFAMEKAKEYSLRTILDIDYRPSIWRDSLTARINDKTILPFTDMVIGNEEEVKFVTGISDLEEAVKYIMSHGPQMVIAKLGAKGSRIFSKKGSFLAPSFKIKVVSNLGAGDGFAAGFCFGLVKGWSLEKTARFANAVGALVASRLSCSEAMPTLAEVGEFLKERGET